MNLKTFRNYAVAAVATLLAEWLIWSFIVPALWYQGSSASFRTAVAFIFISIAVPFIAWFCCQPPKDKRK